MPSSMRSTKREMAMSAPVLPALTQAWASPAFTASMARRMDDCRLPRRALAGGSSMATTSAAWRISIRLRSTWPAACTAASRAK